MLLIPETKDKGRQAERVSGEARWPCYVCGRAVNTKGKTHVWIEVGGGGLHAMLPGEADPSASDYMGFFPVGPDCFRAHPELKDYARKSGEPEQAPSADAEIDAGRVLLPVGEVLDGVIVPAWPDDLRHVGRGVYRAAWRPTAIERGEQATAIQTNPRVHFIMAYSPDELPGWLAVEFYVKAEGAD